MEFGPQLMTFALLSSAAEHAAALARVLVCGARQRKHNAPHLIIQELHF